MHKTEVKTKPCLKFHIPPPQSSPRHQGKKRKESSGEHRRHNATGEAPSARVNQGQCDKCCTQWSCEAIGETVFSQVNDAQPQAHHAHTAMHQPLCDALGHASTLSTAITVAAALSTGWWHARPTASPQCLLTTSGPAEAGPDVVRNVLGYSSTLGESLLSSAENDSKSTKERSSAAANSLSSA